MYRVCRVTCRGSQREGAFSPAWSYAFRPWGQRGVSGCTQIPTLVVPRRVLVRCRRQRRQMADVDGRPCRGEVAGDVSGISVLEEVTGRRRQPAPENRRFDSSGAGGGLPVSMASGACRALGDPAVRTRQASDARSKRSTALEKGTDTMITWRGGGLDVSATAVGHVMEGEVVSTQTECRAFGGLITPGAAASMLSANRRCIQ